MALFTLLRRSFLALVLILPLSAVGQVGIGTNTPNTRALLDLSSNANGLLLPRLSASEITALDTALDGLPSETNNGMMVYDLTNNRIMVYNGTDFSVITGGGGSVVGSSSINITGGIASVANLGVTNGMLAGGITTDKLAASGASNNQILRFVGGVWVPSTESGSLTQGAGISITGGIVSVATTGIVTAMVANGAITDVKLANNAVTTPAILNGAVTDAKIASLAASKLTGTATGDLGGTFPNPTVSGLQGRPVLATLPTLNQVLKWNGTQWAPDNDLTGGGGLTLPFTTTQSSGSDLFNLTNSGGGAAISANSVNGIGLAASSSNGTAAFFSIGNIANTSPLLELNNAGTGPSLRIAGGFVEMLAASAPTTTTNRLYNTGGNLFWNGTQLNGAGPVGANTTLSNLDAGGITANLTFASGANRELAIANAAAGAGDNLTLRAGNPGTNGNGGSVTVQAATGDGTGNGGSLDLNAGGANNIAGSAVVRGGNSVSGQAGGVNILAGSSTSGPGGGIDIRGGAGANGGTTALRGGQGTSTSGGTLQLFGGQGATTGGRLDIVGGIGATNGGTVNIRGGNGTTVGNVILAENLGSPVGFVGIGTNSPTALLDVDASTNVRSSFRIRPGTAPTTPSDGDIWSTGTALFYKPAGVAPAVNLLAAAAGAVVNNGNSFGGVMTVGTDDAFDLVFETDATPRGRFTAGGRLDLGILPPITIPANVAMTSTGDGSSIGLLSVSPTSGSGMFLGRFDAGNTAAKAGQELGRIGFGGFNGTDIGDGAVIQATAEETFSALASGTSLSFNTTAVGANFSATRMRILANGRVNVGQDPSIPIPAFIRHSIVGDSPIAMVLSESDSQGPLHLLARTRAGGTPPLVNDGLGEMVFGGYNGSLFRAGVSIRGIATQDWTVSPASNMEFRTSNGGDANTRMTLTSNGDLLFHQTTTIEPLPSETGPDLTIRSGEGAGANGGRLNLQGGASIANGGDVRIIGGVGAVNSGDVIINGGDFGGGNPGAVFISGGFDDSFRQTTIQLQGGSTPSHGFVAIGNVIAEEKLDVDGAIRIADYKPVNTTNRLYNEAGVLSWNGSPIGGGGGLAIGGNAVAATLAAGTTTAFPLNLLVNNRPAVRIIPGALPITPPAILMGHEANDGGVFGGVTISGGGQGGAPNLVSGDFGTISGGLNNNAGQTATVGGGSSNSAAGLGSAIPGGLGLLASSYGEVAVGTFNTDGGGNLSVFDPADRIFSIGIGESNLLRRDAMTVLKDGRVAFGTSTPQPAYQMTVATIQSGGNSGILLANTLGGATTSTSLDLFQVGGAAPDLSMFFRGVDAGPTTFGAVGTASNSALRFYTNDTVQMTISEGGNVGIGTLGAVERLEVNGRIQLPDQAGVLAGNKLYANAGNLYWGENLLGSSNGFGDIEFTYGANRLIRFRAATATGNGNQLSIRAGQGGATSGSGGLLQIEAGASTTASPGGDLQVLGGSTNTGTAGSVYVAGGAATGGGTTGNLFLANSGGATPRGTVVVGSNIATVGRFFDIRPTLTGGAGAATYLNVLPSVTSQTGAATGLNVDISGVAGGGARYAATFLGGNVGIGTATPTQRLEMVGENVSLIDNIVSNRVHSNDLGSSSDLMLTRTRGTSATPTAVQTSDELGNIVFTGHTGTTYRNGAAIRTVAADNWSGVNQGTAMTFWTSQNFANDNQEKMRIQPNGDVGIGTTSPNARLDIDGGNVILRGLNTGVLDPANTTALELGLGRNSDGTIPTGTAQHDIALQYAAGGFRHFIRSRHNSLTAVNNAIDFFLNTSTTATGSNAPGTGNLLGMSVSATGVGIRTATPQMDLEVRREVVGLVDTRLGGRAYSNDVGSSSDLELFRSRGTSTAPTAIQANDEIGNIYFEGQFGTGVNDFAVGAAITSFATGTYTPTSRPTALTFRTTATSGGLTERVRITEGGNLGIGTSTPNATLQVNGSVSVRLRVLTGTGAANATDHVVLMQTISVATFTLPSLTAVDAGRVMTIVNDHNGTWGTTIDAGTGVTIRRGTGVPTQTISITPGGAKTTLLWNGTRWVEIAS